MKEYRIVATLDTLEQDGVKRRFEAVKPRTSERGGGRFTFRRKDDALRACEEIRRKCAVFDKMTHVRSKQNPGSIWIAFTQSNIRVQERDITDWTDCEA